MSLILMKLYRRKLRQLKKCHLSVSLKVLLCNWNEKWIPANFGTSLQKTKAIFGKSIKNSIMCQMENASQKVPVTLNLWIPSRGTFCVIDFDETLLEKFASVEKMSPVCVIKNVSLLFEQKMVLR